MIEKRSNSQPATFAKFFFSVLQDYVFLFFVNHAFGQNVLDY